MKKIIFKIVLVCTLVIAMCVSAYADDVTPEPVSSDDKVTTTLNPDAIVTPEATSDVIMNDVSNDIAHPAPTEANSDIGSNKISADNPNPPSDIAVEDMLTENPNPPTDPDNDSDGGGTTIAPQTGDSSNVVMLSIAALLSCIFIASCYRKRVNN